MSCTAVISGNVNNAIHNVEYPYAAPATEYVEIPEGSSSAAPVMMPGPKAAKVCRTEPGPLPLSAPPIGGSLGNLSGDLSAGISGDVD
jgi:hypothetical protein